LEWPLRQLTSNGPGVSDTEIKIGNTMPYSGPASSYGTIGKSEAAYFAMIDEQGGINGRKINFISRDEGYSPPKLSKWHVNWLSKIRCYFCSIRSESRQT
jgi:ABC-type branched-subunit amino acid transport system substrate-binding protein